MKEHPILFSGPMVQALLDGSKTQTRRVVKLRELAGDYFEGGAAGVEFDGFRIPRDGGPPPAQFSAEAVGGGAYISEELYCPYGQPGERIWARETVYAYGRWVTRFSAKKKRDEWHFVDMTTECDRRYQYAADNPDVPLATGRGGAMPAWYTRPAIFMPRAACRIVLDITGVRVERLTDCSEADAKAEGVMQLDDDSSRPEVRTKEGWQLCPTCAGTGLHSTLGAGGGVNFDVDCTDCDSHLKLYRHLWEAINGVDSWVANPWVWVIGFKRVTP